MLSWSKQEKSDSFAAIRGMDPYADCLLGPGFADFRPPGELPDEEVVIPCIVQLDDLEALEELRRIALLPRFGPLKDGDSEMPEAGSFFYAFFRKADLEKLKDPNSANARLRDAPKIIELGSPIDVPELHRENWSDQPLPDPDIGPPEGGWPPGTVFMAVIDDGIAFANERFRNADGTSRVQCFWQQDGSPATPTVPHGREHIKADIDLLLQQWSKGDSVEEPGLYRAAGLVRFGDLGHKSAARRVAHGTHVLDLAAGAGPGEDEGKRPIIAVQLPTAATADTSFRRLTGWVLGAIDYILHRASLLAGNQVIPVVINFSYGMFAGPHDGSLVLERAIKNRIDTNDDLPLAVVLPAGNNHLGRHHAEIDLSPTDCLSRSLPWQVQPDDRTDSFVELWLPHGPTTAPTSSRVELSLVTPSGLVSDWLGEEEGWALTLSEGPAELACAFYRFVPGPTERGVFIVCLEPTHRLAPFPAASGTAPAGTWLIRLRLPDEADAADVVIQAWVQRDDSPLGFPRRGRQSYFDADCYRRYDSGFRPIEDDDHPEQTQCVVRRRSLVNALATGPGPLVAGGYRRRSGDIADYSAGGPTTPLAGLPVDPPAQRRPHVLLVSDDSKVLRGVLAAGSASGSMVAISGTSVAAPQLAAWAANQLAQNLPIDVAAIAAASDADPTLPTQRSGVGRLERPPINKAPRGRAGSHD